MVTDASSIVIAGVIGAESGGFGTLSNVRLLAPGPGATLLLDNAGRIVATNGGATEIDDASVYGSGALRVDNGGILSLSNTSIYGGEHLFMGGDTGSTLDFDPRSCSIFSTIYGFRDTDLIDLRNFVGSVSASGNVDPTLMLSGTDSGQTLQFSLSLHGNYSTSSFSTALDASGNGTLLLVNHV